jgi:hypothetical protein
MARAAGRYQHRSTYAEPGPQQSQGLNLTSEKVQEMLLQQHHLAVPA